MREVRRRHVRIVAARAGRTFRVGRLRVAVLWPDGPGFPGEDPNLRATILLVSYGQVDLLLTADAESPVTLPLYPPPVEILKVAHHGSADGACPELHRLRPKVAVISVGPETTTATRPPPPCGRLSTAGLRTTEPISTAGSSVESDGHAALRVRSER